MTERVVYFHAVVVQGSLRTTGRSINVGVFHEIRETYDENLLDQGDNILLHAKWA